MSLRRHPFREVPLHILPESFLELVVILGLREPLCVQCTFVLDDAMPRLPEKGELFPLRIRGVRSLCVIVDGLDEIPHDEGKGPILSLLVRASLPLRVGQVWVLDNHFLNIQVDAVESGVETVLFLSKKALARLLALLACDPNRDGNTDREYQRKECKGPGRVRQGLFTGMKGQGKVDNAYGRCDEQQEPCRERNLALDSPALGLIRHGTLHS